MRQQIDRRSMAMLSAGHVFNDMNQGAVPALLPFLLGALGLSYAAATGLVLAATVSSSIIQPWFGYLADRRPLPWLMPAGLALGGVGLALSGLAPGYPLLFGAIVLSGLGVTCFHPEASRFANYVSGQRRASGMSLFAVGGNIGFALGPALVTPLLLAFGLGGTLWMALPAALMALVLARELPRLETFRPSRIAGSQRGAQPTLPAAWGAFGRLVGVVALRSFVYFGLMTFVPLYQIAVWHASRAEANVSLTVMLVVGAVGTLVGGRLADRFGRWLVLVGAMALVGPLILAYLLAGQALGPALLALIGAATIAPFSVTVVMGQEYLPGRIGVASGVTLGLAIGLGGLGTPLLGLIADHFGLLATPATIAALPVLAAALALTLPRAVPASGEATGALTPLKKMSRV